MSSGKYSTAQVCLNGHTITSSIEKHPGIKEEYCSQCGEPTITACPSCKSNIKGRYDIEGYASFNGGYDGAKAYCHKCGQPFPWTERKIKSAIDSLKEEGNLSDDELKDIESDLIEVTKDSPAAKPAALRLKKTFAKVGSSVGEVLRGLIVSMVSETASKIILGK